MKWYNSSIDIFLLKRGIRLQLTNYVCRAYLQVFKHLFSESRIPSYGSGVQPHWRNALADK